MATTHEARSRLLRFFRVEGANRGLDDAQRRTLQQHLALTRQKREAAQHLFDHGDRAEASLLARAALVAARDAAQVVSFGTSTSDALLLPELPLLDGQFELAHEELYEETLATTRAIEAELADATLDAKVARALRVGRPGFAALLLVALIVVVAVLLRPRPFSLAASVRSDPAVSVDHVMDGDDKTEWALPDNTVGHVDVIMSKPRTIKRVRILNSKNLPGPERGTKEFRVEVFVGGKVEKEIDDSFEKWSREPQWKTFDLGMNNVERVRVVVKSWFGPGGGLSEIVVE